MQPSPTWSTGVTLANGDFEPGAGAHGITFSVHTEGKPPDQSRRPKRPRVSAPHTCPRRKPNPAGARGRIAQCFCLMREAYSLVWSVLVLLFRSRVSLEAEILILRHQLNIQRRHLPKRVAFGAVDRLIFVGLYRLVPNAIKALAIVKPDTVIRWHRAGFRSYWRWKSRNRCGRPTVLLEIRWLIREMSIANPLWGAPRIHGELLKLGVEIGQTSVAKYMVRRRGPP